MPTDGSLARCRSRRGLRIAALLAGLSLSAVAAHAQDATWNLNGTGDFNTGANWTPATVPTGTAIFGVSNQNIVTFSAPPPPSAAGHSPMEGSNTFSTPRPGPVFFSTVPAS